MKIRKSIAIAMALFSLSSVLYAEGTLLEKTAAMEAKAVYTLNANNLKTWKRTSFNPKNLITKDGMIIINSTVVGPIIQKELLNSPKIIEFNVKCKALEPETKKSVLQCSVSFPSSTDPAKGCLYAYRIGKNTIRFIDDAPKAITADAEGNINVKMLFDTATGASEVYVNGANVPVIKHGPFMIKKGSTKIALGDGSSAIEGRCAIISAEVKEY